MDNTLMRMFFLSEKSASVSSTIKTILMWRVLDLSYAFSGTEAISCGQHNIRSIKQWKQKVTDAAARMMQMLQDKQFRISILSYQAIEHCSKNFRGHKMRTQHQPPQPQKDGSLPWGDGNRHLSVCRWHSFHSLPLECHWTQFITLQFAPLGLYSCSVVLTILHHVQPPTLQPLMSNYKLDFSGDHACLLDEEAMAVVFVHIVGLAILQQQTCLLCQWNAIHHVSTQNLIANVSLSFNISTNIA